MMIKSNINHIISRQIYFVHSSCNRPYGGQGHWVRIMCRPHVGCETSASRVMPGLLGNTSAISSHLLSRNAVKTQQIPHVMMLLNCTVSFIPRKIRMTSPATLDYCQNKVAPLTLSKMQAIAGDIKGEEITALAIACYSRKRL